VRSAHRSHRVYLQTGTLRWKVPRGAFKFEVWRGQSPFSPCTNYVGIPSDKNVPRNRCLYCFGARGQIPIPSALEGLTGYDVREVHDLSLGVEVNVNRYTGNREADSNKRRERWAGEAEHETLELSSYNMYEPTWSQWRVCSVEPWESDFLPSQLHRTRTVSTALDGELR
jgi:hypothetical protein